MKKEMKDKTMFCEECSGKVIYDSFRNENYCENCGLVLTPNHEMGKGINGLINYAKHNGLHDSIESIRTIGTFQGLRDARLEVAKLVLNK